MVEKILFCLYYIWFTRLKSKCFLSPCKSLDRYFSFKSHYKYEICPF